VAHEAENTACGALARLCGERLPTPTWLLRPGKSECGARWGLVQRIYRDLVGATMSLREVMPPREHRKVDGFYRYRGTAFLFELDERQHFNRYRAITLRSYPADLPLAFDADEWLRRCDAKTKVEGGGWGRPRPPLFPGAEGRHKQRAFRDALADILPTVHGYLPTLRLTDTEVLPWIANDVVEDRMMAILEDHYPEASTRSQE
jgi:hypothetical protein